MESRKLLRYRSRQKEGQVIQLYGTQITYHVHRIDFERWWLVCTLPSGRHMACSRPKTDTVNQWGRPVLSFRTEWMGRTQREQTYGGRLVENIVQGVARDIMCIGAIQVQAMGRPVFMLVHDEVVALGDESEAVTDRILLKQALLDLPEWCQGLPLDASVRSMDRYTNNVKKFFHFPLDLPARFARVRAWLVTGGTLSPFIELCYGNQPS